MPFDWNDYYLLAERLKQGDEEASRRSAISRAYYSVYRQARNYLVICGVNIPETGSVHKFVWNHYRSAGGKTFSAIGINGDRLHRNRTRADYDNEVESLNESVGESFRYATNVLFYLKQLRRKTN